MKGIDIANCDRIIDFNKVKNSGVKTVIIKATEGVNFRDSNLEVNYRGAKGKFNLGFYHFMSEKTDPTQQAIDFWNAIKDKEFNVYPVLDIETNNMNRSCKEISDRCIQFLEKFEAISGFRCIIYTGGYFGRDNLDDRVKKYLGWIAHYGVSKPMETGFKVVGHQYSETGKVDGINANVDMDNFTDEILIKGKSNAIIKETKIINNNSPKLISQNGVCTVIVDELTIREKPSVNSNKVGSYVKGEQVSYDYYVDNEGYRWISWVAAKSGKRRYMAVRVLSTNKKYGNCV